MATPNASSWAARVPAAYDRIAGQWSAERPSPAAFRARPFVDRLCITNGMTAPATEIETVSDSFGRSFMRQSNAVWIISAGVVANEIASGAFVALPVDTEETKGPVGLTMRTDTAPSPAFTILLQTIREAARPGK